MKPAKHIEYDFATETSLFLLDCEESSHNLFKSLLSPFLKPTSTGVIYGILVMTHMGFEPTILRL